VIFNLFALVSGEKGAIFALNESREEGPAFYFLLMEEFRRSWLNLRHPASPGKVAFYDRLIVKEFFAA